MEEFQLLEEIATGEMSLVVRGDSLEGLFRAAARGLFETMVDTEAVRPEIGKELLLSADSIDRLLYRWLSELIQWRDRENLYFSFFEVQIERGARHRMQGVVMGELNDPTRHPARNEVTAVRPHPFQIVREGDAWQVSVLLDR
ncbi:MAG: archease [Candidatus Manganitrophaceae bacterium]|nr:MAG: archease [Candidatus Manganitrophaceae bacterium]